MRVRAVTWAIWLFLFFILILYKDSSWSIANIKQELSGETQPGSVLQLFFMRIAPYCLWGAFYKASKWTVYGINQKRHNFNPVLFAGNWKCYPWLGKDSGENFPNSRSEQNLVSYNTGEMLSGSEGYGLCRYPKPDFANVSGELSPTWCRWESPKWFAGRCFQKLVSHLFSNHHN